MKDKIEREILVKAPIEKVWNFVNQPAWWVGDGPGPDKVEIDGLHIVADTKYGQFPVRVEDSKEPHYLACRWASSFAGEEPNDDNSTLVEFQITKETEGTLVKVIESGFLKLPVSTQDRIKFYEGNVYGGEKMLEFLKESVEQ